MAVTRVIPKTPVKNADEAIAILDELSDALGVQGLAMHYAHIDSVQAAKLGITTHDVTWTDVSTDAGCIARANAIKAAFNLHAAEASYTHEAADATYGAVATADATDVATASTLLAALKTAINGHVRLKSAHRGRPGYTEAVAETPSDSATNITTCNQILEIYKRHVYSYCPNIERVAP